MIALRRIFLRWANIFLYPSPKIGSANLGFSVLQWELIINDDVSLVPISLFYFRRFLCRSLTELRRINLEAFRRLDFPFSQKPKLLVSLFLCYSFGMSCNSAFYFWLGTRLLWYRCR